MISPPPLIDSAHSNDVYNCLKEEGTLVEPFKPIREATVTRQYAQACTEVAKAENVPLVDAWSAIVEAAGGERDEQLAPYFL